MSDKEVSPRVAGLLLKIRDALVEKNVDEAYYFLYKIASPEFDKKDAWKELESIQTNTIKTLTMPLSIGELLLEAGLKIVRQEKKIKKLKAKVALLEQVPTQQRPELKL